jgi:hypothetical protein
MCPQSYLCEHLWVHPRKGRSARKSDARDLHCQDEHLMSPTYDCGAGKDAPLNDSTQGLGGAISNRYKTGLLDSCSTPTKTYGIMSSVPQLDFHLLKQLSSISTILPSSHPLPFNQPPQKSSMEKAKRRMILPCSRTATSLWQFVGQHRILHDNDVSENGASLWMKNADNNRQPTLKIIDILLAWLVPFTRQPHFC